MIKKILCYFFHSWKYYTKTINVKNYIIIGRSKEINFPMRECKRCGYKEHHMMPMLGNMKVNWKPYNLKQ